jgi:hypothetical protein
MRKTVGVQSYLDLSIPNVTVNRKEFVSLKATSTLGGGPLHLPESVSSHVTRRIWKTKI